MALMGKMIDFAQKGRPFAILSATYVENLENYIFVEAYKNESVREAIQGLSFCYNKIDIMPLDEMTKIYEDQDAQLQRPKAGQWVRIKNGLYQDDLGYVDKFVGDHKIYVKLIPRIDPVLAPKSDEEKQKC